MKLWSQIVQLAIICAAIAAGAWSGVELCDWQDPITEEEARLAADGKVDAMAVIRSR